MTLSPEKTSLASPYTPARAVMRWIIAAFFVFAGIGHFMIPDALVSITPDWVPFPRQVILLTGLFELAAALALVSKPLRFWAGIALAVYTVCVYPANIKHAIEAINIPNLPSSWWYHAPRLALQPVIAWWVLFSAGVIDWPWRRR
jgi:uncharacterized membrane protein